ncbi:hypothetical protein Btru_035558 [Bulinus truncatus]|nr:hypothetical protein Btru_035558 [Bulinus truncatus]
MSFEDQSNTFKILVATDIHLGFKERDPVRGKDSLNTFEEILQIARDREVDFILLGGDLFHDNKPSRSTLHGCLALLRKYCMGDKPVHFEYLSDQSIDFKHCTFPNVNYEEPNFNISIPLFSIHGNHDDPTGPGNLCSLDLLHTAGLVNYFGKATSLDEIQISPLLLKKGETKIALYGLGSVRDERLHRMFLKKKVSMLRPKMFPESWFNIFVIHQNRVPHTPTNHIPEHFLDDFLDLVFWGHEHECLLTDKKPAKSSNQNFSICQPGSSIATSLKESETVLKHVRILEINGKKCQMTPVPLMTVRQLYIENINLNEYVKRGEPDSKMKAESLCIQKVKEILKKAREEHNARQPSRPLVRLIINYSDFEPFSSQRFGQKFIKKVANPQSMILLKRQKKINDVSDKKDISFGGDSLDDFITKILSENSLCLLSTEAMNEALTDSVIKDDNFAIKQLVQRTLTDAQSYLNECTTSEESFEKAFEDYTSMKMEKEKPVPERVKSTANVMHIIDEDLVRYKEFKDQGISSKTTYKGMLSKSTNQGISYKDKLQGMPNFSTPAMPNKKDGSEIIKSFHKPADSCSGQSLRGTEDEPILIIDSQEEDLSNECRIGDQLKSILPPQVNNTITIPFQEMLNNVTDTDTSIAEARKQRISNNVTDTDTSISEAQTQRISNSVTDTDTSIAEAQKQRILNSVTDRNTSSFVTHSKGMLCNITDQNADQSISSKIKDQGMLKNILNQGTISKLLYHDISRRDINQVMSRTTLDQCMSSKAIDQGMSSKTTDQGMSSKIADQGMSSKITDQGMSNKTTDQGMSSKITDQGMSSKITDQGMSSKITDQGMSSKITDQGISSKITDQGMSSKITDQGMSSKITDQGMSSKITDQGMSSKITDQGISSKITDQDMSSKITDQGISSKITDQGMSSKITDQGMSSKITDQGMSNFSISSMPNRQGGKLSKTSAAVEREILQSFLEPAGSCLGPSVRATIHDPIFAIDSHVEYWSKDCSTKHQKEFKFHNYIIKPFHEVINNSTDTNVRKNGTPSVTMSSNVTDQNAITAVMQSKMMLNDMTYQNANRDMTINLGMSGNVKDNKAEALCQQMPGNVRDNNAKALGQRIPGNVKDTNAEALGQRMPGNVRDNTAEALGQRMPGNVRDNNAEALGQRMPGNVRDTNAEALGQRMPGNVRDTNAEALGQRMPGNVRNNTAEALGQLMPGNVRDKNAEALGQLMFITEAQNKTYGKSNYVIGYNAHSNMIANQGNFARYLKSVETLKKRTSQNVQDETKNRVSILRTATPNEKIESQKITTYQNVDSNNIPNQSMLRDIASQNLVRTKSTVVSIVKSQTVNNNPSLSHSVSHPVTGQTANINRSLSHITSHLVRDQNTHNIPAPNQGKSNIVRGQNIIYAPSNSGFVKGQSISTAPPLNKENSTFMKGQSKHIAPLPERALPCFSENQNTVIASTSGQGRSIHVNDQNSLPLEIPNNMTGQNNGTIVLLSQTMLKTMMSQNTGAILIPSHQLSHSVIGQNDGTSWILHEALTNDMTGKNNGNVLIPQTISNNTIGQNTGISSIRSQLISNNASDKNAGTSSIPPQFMSSSMNGQNAGTSSIPHQFMSSNLIGQNTNTSSVSHQFMSSNLIGQNTGSSLRPQLIPNNSIGLSTGTSSILPQFISSKLIGQNAGKTSIPHQFMSSNLIAQNTGMSLKPILMPNNSIGQNTGMSLKSQLMQNNSIGLSAGTSSKHHQFMSNNLIGKNTGTSSKPHLMPNNSIGENTGTSSITPQLMPNNLVPPHSLSNAANQNTNKVLTSRNHVINATDLLSSTITLGTSPITDQKESFASNQQNQMEAQRIRPSTSIPITDQKDPFTPEQPNQTKTQEMKPLTSIEYLGETLNCVGEFLQNISRIGKRSGTHSDANQESLGKTLREMLTPKAETEFETPPSKYRRLN